MTRPTHPAWCALGHHCTADRMTVGEHASTPQVWATTTGRLVVTRYRTTDGRDRIELRVIAKLPTDDRAALLQARQLVAVTGTALHAVFDPASASSMEGHLR